MECMRLLQQRGLRQIFQSRPLRTQHGIPEVVFSYSSMSPRRCLNSRRRTLSTLPNGQRLSARSDAPSSRFAKPTRRFVSTSNPSPSSSSSSSSPPEQALSLTQRMRRLSREYGYAALGVYLALSAIDLPFCYLAVSYLGTERIGRWEHEVLSYIKGLVKWPMGEEGKDTMDETAELAKQKVLLGEVQGEKLGKGNGKRVLDEKGDKEDGGEVFVLEDHGYTEAKRADRGENASFWTKLALAYAIHKSFIFIRVPLTAAVTPKVVRTLRSWGWNIGKMPPKKSAPATGKTGVKVEGDK